MTDDPDRRPPDWELEMILDVADRWDITWDAAEAFLENVGAFGPKSEWPSENGGRR